MLYAVIMMLTGLGVAVAEVYVKKPMPSLFEVINADDGCITTQSVLEYSRLFRRENSGYIYTEKKL